MAKRPASSRPALTGGSRAALPGPARPRDPVTRLARLCEIMALGLVAAALFLRFPNALNLGGAAPIPWNYFPSLLQNMAVLAVHTPAAWVAMALLGMIVALGAYRARQSKQPHRMVILGTLAALLVIALHAGALGYLQSQGTLKVEVRGPAPAGLESRFFPQDTTRPAAIDMESVTRLTVAEGTTEEWKLLFAGDMLFGAPILFAWLLRLVASKLTPRDLDIRK